MRVVVTDVRGIFAALRPLGRDAERFAHGARSAFDRDLSAQLGRHVPRLFRHTLTATGAGGCAFADGIDQGTPRGFLRDGIGGEIEREQAHRALEASLVFLTSNSKHPTNQLA